MLKSTFSQHLDWKYEYTQMKNSNVFLHEPRIFDKESSACGWIPWKPVSFAIMDTTFSLMSDVKASPSDRLPFMFIRKEKNKKMLVWSKILRVVTLKKKCVFVVKMHHQCERGTKLKTTIFNIICSLINDVYITINKCSWHGIPVKHPTKLTFYCLLLYPKYKYYTWRSLSLYSAARVIGLLNRVNKI